MGRRRSSEPEPQSPAICQRMEWLLVNEFKGSITLMSSALKVSHTALSRVINKGQMPSGQMLEGLARLGRINLQWLLVGDEGADWPRIDRSYNSAPISRHLLRDAPSRVPEQLTALSLPVATPYLLCDPYWFQVPSKTQLVTAKSSKIVAHDFLLIEAGPAWTSRSEAWIGRMVVLQAPKKPQGLLAQVEPLPVSGKHLETVGYDVSIIDDINANKQSSMIFTRVPTAPEEAPEQKPHRFTISDVVGVVLEVRAVLASSTTGF